MKYRGTPLDFTPMVDFLLVIIFAYMIQNQRLAYAQTNAADSLQQVVNQLQKDLAYYRQNLDSSQLKAIAYQQALAEQKQLLDSTMLTVSDKLTTFFQNTDLQLRKQLQNGELTAADYQQFKKKIDELFLDGNTDIVEQIYILGELQAYATVIDVYLDEDNEIYIRKESQNIALVNFDERLNDFPEQNKQAFVGNLGKKLNQVYMNGSKGNNKFGDVILITFGHSNRAMRGVIKLSERQTADFYRQLKNAEPDKKIFYSNLGFYPF